MEVTFSGKSGDERLDQAAAAARETFRYFWRELSWEYQRIVPALSVTAVKSAFREGDVVEHMWLSDVRFDGAVVSGVLLNSPNQLRRIKAGAKVELPLAQVTDWLYALNDKAYGGFTVSVLRGDMPPQQRMAHDKAWGLEFEDEVRVVPAKWAGEAEHPMAVNMGPSLEDALKRDPQLLTATDAAGVTLLHRLALAGTVIGVKILLAHGARRDVRAKNGMTALDMARALGWRSVAEQLESVEDTR